MAAPNYVVISPVRNEAAYLPETIRCMAAQSVRPKQWVVVDDGSTDGTGRIIETAAAQYPWIRIVYRTDRGFRQAGGGVIEAFYDGFGHIAELSWEFLVKFDGDLSFSSDYFERCLERFDSNPKLGVGGGTICNQVNGALEPESKIDPAFHVRGATKIYRRACWEAIGGLLRQPGWDTLDEVKANMLGWITSTFPDVKLLHNRPAGRAYGTWSNWVKNGLANYIAGYHPLFMAVKCLKRTGKRPLVTAALGLACGFLSGYWKGVPRVNDPALIKYFRRHQLRRLFFRESLWDQKPVL
jgi:poly-beta-1,6-N-acetyl-D-glucosamine synthase